MSILPYVAAAGALAALAAVPFALPTRAHVERSAVIDSEPAAVYGLISSTAGFDRINPFRAQDPTLKVEPFGPALGVGAGFRWTGKQGAGSQTIIRSLPGREVAMRLDLGVMGEPIQTLTLEPVAGGTRVTWSLDAQLGSNPLRRLFGLGMDRMLGPIYDRGLANLAAATAA